MDQLVDFLAQLDVPPVLVAGLAAFTVGYALYELLVKRRVQASQAERKLRGYLSDEVEDAAFDEIAVALTSSEQNPSVTPRSNATAG